MRKKKGWEIYEKSPSPHYFWQFPENTGLLLSQCAKCGERQTPKTYLRGFWSEFRLLCQGYSIIGIAKCSHCGAWHRMDD